MFDRKWTASEKKIARAAYDKAFEAARNKVVAEFKLKASAVTSASDMWAMEDFLHDARQELDRMSGYAYSRLPLVFAWAIRCGHIVDADLDGLSDDKREHIRRITTPL